MLKKHIELFKRIPCGNFGASRLFFDAFKTKNPKTITTDDIFLAYYYISSEMMDSEDSRHFIVQKKQPPFNEYDCHNPLTDAHMLIRNFKSAKVYNGVIKKYCNRTPNSKHYGLVAVSKQQNDNLDEIIQDFKIFAQHYKSEHFRHDIFTNERRYCLGNEELDHLYNLLKTLCNRATFRYKQPGSIILAQEMASVMANQNIVKNNQHTPGGAEYVHKHKLFMFGELTHEKSR